MNTLVAEYPTGYLGYQDEAKTSAQELRPNMIEALYDYMQ